MRLDVENLEWIKSEESENERGKAETACSKNSESTVSHDSTGDQIVMIDERQKDSQSNVIELLEQDLEGDPFYAKFYEDVGKGRRFFVKMNYGYIVSEFKMIERSWWCLGNKCVS